MPTLQTAFTDFHDAIKLSDFDENAAPTGISLTVLAYNLFSPNYTVDVFKNGARTYNDFAALRSLVKSIRQKFVMVFDENNNICYSIRVNILTPPHNDLFEKMTLNQKTAFYNEVAKLLFIILNVENILGALTLQSLMQENLLSGLDLLRNNWTNNI